MFGYDFYPTPPELVARMVAKVDTGRVKNVLEPSAGKGDIIEGYHATQKTEYAKHRVLYCENEISFDCVEIDENLRHILKGRKYPVIHDDFLTFQTYKRYDLIIMNPPFSEGDKHLSQALHIATQTGGQIVCLLNAETLKNQYTMSRKNLSSMLSQLNADIEYLSDAFIDAERETGVEIALIYLDIPRRRPDSIILDHLRKAPTFEASIPEANKPIHSNYIDGLVEQFNTEARSGMALINDFHAIQPLLNPEDDYSPILKLTVGKSDYTKDGGNNEYLNGLRLKYWKALFQSNEITKRLTSQLFSELQGRVNEFEAYDFTHFNIFQLLQDLATKTTSSIENTIIELFDTFIRYSMDDRTNTHYFNGWKTNSCYKVGKKIIMPLYAWDSWSNKFDLTYYETSRKLQDIEKVFDFLDGQRSDHVDLLDTLGKAQKFSQNKHIRTKYFDMSFFKKGTLHLVFHSEELLKKFNLFGAQRKNWLPPGYGKKQYQDMDNEERAVVDSYEGEASYEEMMRDKEFFIVESGKLLAIDA